MYKAKLSIAAAAICALAMAAVAIAGLTVNSLAQPCCNVIGIDVAKSTLEVRNRFTGRLMQINSAELADTLKIGDELDADPSMMRTISIKGLARTAALREPDPAEPCCGVVSIAKDEQIANGLLSGLMTDAGKPYGAVAPFLGIVIAKDLKTGVAYVLDTGVESPQAVGSASTSSRTKMSQVINDLKVDDPVWVSSKHGIVKGKGGMYAFKLRGGDEKGKQPWVIEPDPPAAGRNGIVRTNWHEKTSSNYQGIYVYLPGQREKQEYYEFFKREHKLMEGEYDMKINGMILEKVPVKAGHSTRILLGAIHSAANYANQLAIHDSEDKLVMKIHGGETIALPIGTYNLKVGTRTIKVDVKENEVTEV